MNLFTFIVICFLSSFGFVISSTTELSAEVTTKNSTFNPNDTTTVATTSKIETEENTIYIIPVTKKTYNETKWYKDPVYITVVVICVIVLSSLSYGLLFCIKLIRGRM